MRRPKAKRLGQHFLVEDAGVELFLRGIDMLGCVRDYDAAEVGPGRGALTRAISGLFRRLVAVEIDPALAAGLAGSLPSNAGIVVADGVSMLSAMPIQVVVSNTPFNITSKLVVTMAKNNNVVGGVIGAQAEVARRMAAKPGTDDYGRLSVISQAYFDVSLVGVIPSEWFKPKPKVSAAVVVLKRRRKWDARGEILEGLLRCAFRRRNRVARRALAECLSAESLPIDVGDRRVRDLTVDEYLRLAEWAGARGSLA